MATILSGKEVSLSIKKELHQKIKKLSNDNVVPKLAAVLIGDNPASKIYVTSKHNTFIKMNCLSEVFHLEKNVTELEIFNLINKLNNDDSVHGILLQLPLPNHLKENNIINFINPSKDVDGLHPNNVGNLLLGAPSFIPCTPFGCLKILEYYKICTESKDIVIVGRSNLVGKPLFAYLSQKFKNGNATVTLCHSRTKNISQYTKKADIIIAAVGKPGLIKDDMVKNDSVVIDVGINRINDDSEKGYHIQGDVDFNNVVNKVNAVTPVPGGVGVMTVTMLVFNTILAAENSMNN